MKTSIKDLGLKEKIILIIAGLGLIVVAVFMVIGSGRFIKTMAISAVEEVEDDIGDKAGGVIEKLPGALDELNLNWQDSDKVNWAEKYSELEKEYNSKKEK